jgi:hypothetical protein
MTTDWTALLIAFVGGSLMATVISAFVRYLVVHPVISVRLNQDRGSYGPLVDVFRGAVVSFSGAVDTIEAHGNTYKARYVRLHVENTGLSSIKDCSGYITQITKTVAGGAQKTRSQQEVIDLSWAHQGDSTRDIPRGAFFHLDVASIHQWPGTEWKLQLPRGIPTTLTEFLAGKATYTFEVLVAADNARPRRFRVEVDYDPNSDELRFNPVNKARYPWWAFWRWPRAFRR